ncbi:MAG: HupE/UreJ family protein [Bryobacteraceae bacterium]
MKVVLALALAAAPVFAHVMSMSSGDLAIRGTHAQYEFRLPLYETAHIRNPEQALFQHIHFSSNGAAARQVAGACREDPPSGSYVCDAEYEFAGPVGTLDVDCAFYEVTVPNHVHLLRVDNNGKHDQGLFDISFPKATLRFHPPTPFEIAATQVGAGFMRAVGGYVQILFLASLVLAARSRRELFLLAGMFWFGQAAVTLLLPLTTWQPASRFVEAAAALTIAYLAVEILMLPQAGMRWLIVGVLGGFHGLYFYLFLRTTAYRSGFVLLGAGVAEVLLIAFFAFVFSRLARRIASLKPVPVSAALLLVFGMAWFVLRLKS